MSAMDIAGDIASGMLTIAGKRLLDQISGDVPPAGRDVRRSGPLHNLRGTPFTTPHSSTRKGDTGGTRARVDGDGVMVNLVRHKPVKFSLGRSINVDTTDFLRQLFNRSTTVGISGGYKFHALTGQRAFHFQHFRHNAYPDAATKYSYEAFGAGDDDIKLIEPAYEESTDFPKIKTALKPVYSTVGSGSTQVRNVNGSKGQYAPYSLVDLENFSYELQAGKYITSQTQWLPDEGGAEGSDVEGTKWLQNPFLQNRRRFAPRSRIFQNNQLAELVTGGGSINNNLIKCKPVLKGGKVEYLFTNTGNAPAVVTVIVYKVKNTFNQPGTGYTFDENRLTSRLIKNIQTAYLDQGDKIRLKDLGGRVPIDEDVTFNPQKQFLPNLKLKVPSACPYVEQMRYCCVVQAGATKNIDISLPGRMYDPCTRSQNKTFVQPVVSNDNVVDEQDYGLDELNVLNSDTKPQQWTGEQYSIAVGVSGCETMAHFTSQQGTDTSSSVIEGKTTAPATVECRVRYTERIGAMHMTYKSLKIQGDDDFSTPTIVPQDDSVNNAKLDAIFVTPMASAVRQSDSNGNIVIK